MSEEALRVGEKTSRASEAPILVAVEKCDLCGGCIGICPTDCIVLTEHNLMIVGSECIRCGLCLPACPVGALTWNDGDVAAGQSTEAGDNGK